MKDDLFRLAESRAKALLESYKTQDYVSIASRFTSPKPQDLSSEVISEKPHITVTSWGQREPDSRLAIIVETRRKSRWIAAYKVSAYGFFIEQSGTITPMEEKDLWSHGY